MYNNRPYRGSKYERKHKIRSVILIILILIILISISGFISLQDHIVFTSDGIRIDLPWTNSEKKDTTTDSINEPNFEIAGEEASNPSNNDISSPITPSVTLSDTTKTLYIPATNLANDDIISQLIDLKNKGYINSVTTDIKNSDGTLNYVSKIEYLSNINNTSNIANIIPLRIKSLNDAGINVIGKISCFNDNIFAQSVRDAAVSTASGATWLDYSNKRHLNPYSDKTKQYISDIIAECDELGLSEVVLTDFSFPSEGKLNYISYKNQTLTKSEILLKRLNEFSKIGQTNNVLISIYLSDAISNEGINATTGQDTASFYKEVSKMYVGLQGQSDDGENLTISSISKLTGDSAKIVPIYSRTDYFQKLFDPNITNKNCYFDLIENNYSLMGLVE